MTRTEILETAKNIVTGHREEEYGSPEDNFECIARLWETYMATRCVGIAPDIDVSINAEDVAVMMMLFKIVRLSTGGGSADTWIDIAGYAACGGEISDHGIKSPDPDA